MRTGRRIRQPKQSRMSSEERISKISWQPRTESGVLG